MGGWGAGHQESGPRGGWALLQRGDVIGTQVGLPARVGGRQARLGAAPGVGRAALSTGHRSRASLQNPTSRPPGASPGGDGCRAGVRKAEPSSTPPACEEGRPRGPEQLSSRLDLSTERPQVLCGGHGGLPGSRLTAEVPRPARRPSPTPVRGASSH